MKIIPTSLLVAVATLVLASSASAAKYKVIVNPANPVTQLTKKQIKSYFLKEATEWADGSAIRPVDQPRSSKVRSAFSKELLGKSVGAVKSTWQKKMFSGRAIPPPEKAANAVIAYVLAHPGAIGYIDGELDSGGTKVVTVK